MKDLNSDTVHLSCPDCDSTRVEMRYEEDEFEYGSGDNVVTLKATVPVNVCMECGFSFTGEKAAKTKHDVVCRHLGILTPIEILELRTSLSLSRNAFAELSGIGIASLARWESGDSHQSRSNDNLLRLLSFQDNVERVSRIKDGENIRADLDQRNHSSMSKFKALRPKQLDNLRVSQEQFSLRRIG